MKSGKNKGSNVIPSLKTDSRGRENIKSQGSASEGVIPHAFLKKHGVAISGAQNSTPDPKKQADVGMDDDAFLG